MAVMKSNVCCRHRGIPNLLRAFLSARLLSSELAVDIVVSAAWWLSAALNFGNLDN
jgi:hypothetical protein